MESWGRYFNVNFYHFWYVKAQRNIPFLLNTGESSSLISVTVNAFRAAAKNLLSAFLLFL